MLRERKADTQGLLFLIYGVIVAVIFIIVVFIKIGQLSEYDEIAAYAHADEMRMIVEAMDSSKTHVQIGYSLGQLKSTSIDAEGDQGYYSLRLSYSSSSDIDDGSPALYTSLPLGISSATTIFAEQNSMSVKRIISRKEGSSQITFRDGIQCGIGVQSPNIIESEIINAMVNLDDMENWGENVWEELERKSVYFESRAPNKRLTEYDLPITIIASDQNTGKACTLYLQLKERFTRANIRMIIIEASHYQNIAIPEKASGKEVLFLVQ